MKNIFYYLIILLHFIISPSASAQINKQILFEASASSSNELAPRAIVFARELQKKHGDEAIFINAYEYGLNGNKEYHDSLYLSDYHLARINRKSEIAPLNLGFLDLHIQNGQEDQAPANISVSTTYDETSRELKINLEAEFFTQQMGDYSFAAIVTEGNVIGSSIFYQLGNAFSGESPGTMDGFELLPNPVPPNLVAQQNIGKQLIGGFNGVSGSIPFSITSGKYYEDFTWTVPNGDDLEYLRVVGVLIDNSSGQVVNAAKSEYILGGNNTSPIFNDFDAAQTHRNSGLNYLFAVHDAEYDELTVEIEGMPSWMSLIKINDEIYKLDGTTNNLGTYPLIIKVSDGEFEIEKEFNVEIFDYPWEFKSELGFELAFPDKTQIRTTSTDDQYIFYRDKNNKGNFRQLINNAWSEIDDSFTDVEKNGYQYKISNEDEHKLFLKGSLYQFENDTWELLGQAGTSSGLDKLEVIDNNNIVVAFQNEINNNQISIQRWNGSSFLDLQAPESNNIILDYKIKALHSNTIILVVLEELVDQNNSIKSYLYDGSSWNLVTQNELTAINPEDIQLSSSKTGGIYLSFIESPAVSPFDKTLQIFQLQSTNWKLIKEDFHDTFLYQHDLLINSEDQLITALSIYSGGNRKVNVRLSTENGWQNIGPTYFPTQKSVRPSLLEDNNGLIHLYYRINNSEGKLYHWSYDYPLVTVSTFENKPAPSIKLYPNPVSDLLTIEYSAGVSYELIDLNGIIIKSGSLQINNGVHLNQKSIPISNLKSGIYYVVIRDGSEYLSTGFVKR